jgi:ribose-phosphate pyrophosphokinase
MAPRLVAGTANVTLATATAEALGEPLVACDVERFPDGELHPLLPELRGDDVYVLQPLAPPVHEHLIELLLLLDASKRAGARRTTAVVAYFAYARQDRRVRAGEALGARVVAEALRASGADRLVVVDPHTPALEAMCPMGVETLSAEPVLSAQVAPLLAADAVIVAPDLGAVKLAERYARRLGRAVAVVRKTRVSGSEVISSELVGDVVGRPALVVDDMISTGATIEAALEVLRRYGAGDDVLVAATHAVLAGDAIQRLASLGARLFVTDTIPPPNPSFGLGDLLIACSVAPLLAEAIRRLHEEAPLEGLIARW